MLNVSKGSKVVKSQCSVIELFSLLYIEKRNLSTPIDEKGETVNDTFKYTNDSVPSVVPQSHDNLKRYFKFYLNTYRIVAN